MNGVRARIQAQPTILIGKNVPPATASVPNVTRLAFGVGEWDGFCPKGELKNVKLTLSQLDGLLAVSPTLRLPSVETLTQLRLG